MKHVNQYIELDGIDKEIVRELMKNARQSISEIAKKLNLSNTAIHQRIKKLEDSEVISGSRIVINAEKLGYNTIAFIGVFLKDASKNKFIIKALNQITEVTECHYTTGHWSLLIKIICKNNKHLMDILNKQIQNIEGVSRTETFISLQQQIYRQINI